MLTGACSNNISPGLNLNVLSLPVDSLPLLDTATKFTLYLFLSFISKAVLPISKESSLRTTSTNENSSDFR